MSELSHHDREHVVSELKVSSSWPFRGKSLLTPDMGNSFGKFGVNQIFLNVPRIDKESLTEGEGI
jgi:hypothetical protein